MKVVISVIVAVVMMVGSMAFQAKAQEQGLNGLLIGAGSGALIGQAIGRNAEGTLVGTAVGGVVGYMVGSEIERGRHGRVYDPPGAVVVSPPSIEFSYRPHYRDRHYRYRDYPRFHPLETCRKIISVEPRHGRYREVVRVECWERDRWRGHRPGWR